MPDLSEEFDDFEVFGSGDLVNGVVSFYEFFDKNHESMPWNDLEERGLIDSGRNVHSFAPLLPHVGNREGLFRKAESSNDVSSFLWLSAVKMLAMNMLVSHDGVGVFHREAINSQFLSELVKLSSDASFIREMGDYLAGFGVLLVYLPHFKGSKVDGAVGVLPNGSPFIGMSLRYPRLDHYWFTLLHELAHIFRHYDQLVDPIIDDLDETPDGQIEIEANFIAQESIVARAIWNRSNLKRSSFISEVEVAEYAKNVSVHPALIAGKIQRERDNYKILRSIVDEIDTRQVLGING